MQKPVAIMSGVIMVCMSLTAPGYATGREMEAHYLQVHGIRRRYVTYIPNSISERPAVVIVLHGVLGNSWTASWDTKMKQQASKHGFIAVFPEGTGRTSRLFLTWNAGKCCGRIIEFPPISDAVKHFVTNNECSPEPTIKQVGETKVETYTNGKNGTEVCLITVPTGHAWPGGRRAVPFADKAYKKFNASEEIWSFFANHSKTLDEKSTVPYP